MKQIHLFFNLLVIIMLLPTIAACDKDNGGNDAIAIAPFEFMIKFESSMGTNILDSLQVQPTNETESNQLGDLTFQWTNKNNDLNPHWSTPLLGWYKTTEDWGGFNPYFSFKGVGTILEVKIYDISIWDTSNGKYPRRDEEYTITLTSKKIFGNENPHTIKFYIHIKGKAVYDTYKCEVDGVEQQLLWRDYNPNKLPENKELAGALVIIKTK